MALNTLKTINTGENIMNYLSMNSYFVDVHYATKHYSSKITHWTLICIKVYELPI